MDLSLFLSKCEFGKTSIQCLRHQVDRNGIRPLADKVEVIESYPQPTNVQEFRRFLAIINFYHRFLPHAAEDQRELQLLCNGQKKQSKKHITFSMNPAETKYSAYDPELLSAYLAVKHFKNIIEGRDLTIFTDHKPLTFAFQQKIANSVI